LRKLACAVTAAFALFPAAAAARPPFGLAARMADERAWRVCNNLYPLDPYEERCLTAGCPSWDPSLRRRTRHSWLFLSCWGTNQARRTWLFDIRVYDNSRGGYSTRVTNRRSIG
jgi:hypothetical protein